MKFKKNKMPFQLLRAYREFGGDASIPSNYGVELFPNVPGMSADVLSSPSNDSDDLEEEFKAKNKRRKFLNRSLMRIKMRRD